jgi:hypothetical protein
MFPLKSSHPGYALHDAPFSSGACPITIADFEGLLPFVESVAGDAEVSAGLRFRVRSLRSLLSGGLHSDIFRFEKAPNGIYQKTGALFAGDSRQENC